jgi:hypothetical protein
VFNYQEGAMGQGQSLGRVTALAAAGVVGGIGGANANTVTVTENLSPWAGNTNTPIYLDGSLTAQFSFVTTYQPPQFKHHQPQINTAHFDTDPNGLLYAGIGSPVIDPNLTYQSGEISTFDYNSFHGVLYELSGYLNIAFINEHGGTDYGYAAFSDGMLTTITYSSTNSSVPEPVDSDAKCNPVDSIGSSTKKSGFPVRTPAFCSVSRGPSRLGEKEYRAPSMTPGVALRPRTQGLRPGCC